MRQFLKGKRRISPSVSAAIVKLDKWTGSILSETQSELDPIRAKVILARDCDTIENIARSFVHNSKEIENQLILKSMQEALLYCVEFNLDLSYAQTRKRVKEYIVRRDRLALIRRFLSLFFFNFVWYYTSESFRALAWTSADFESEMENIETLCQQLVAAAVSAAKDPLDSGSANTIVRDIERSLRD
jgi:hypothetical protein